MGKGSSSEPAGSALHTVGSRVWVWSSDSKGGGEWERAEVVAMLGPKLRVRLEGGSERECSAADIPLQNSSANGVEVSSLLVQWVGCSAGAAKQGHQQQLGGARRSASTRLHAFDHLSQCGWDGCTFPAVLAEWDLLLLPPPLLLPLLLLVLLLVLLVLPWRCCRCFWC